MGIVEVGVIWAYEALRQTFDGNGDHVARSDLVLGLAEDLYRPFRRVPFVVKEGMRLQHCHLLGASGTGKTTLMEGMIRQDIRRGRGLAQLDAHGDSFQRVLRFLASQPVETWDRAVVIDPADRDWAVGLNPLSVPPGASAFSHALELVAAFRKAWPQSWGPRLEEMLRCLLVSLSEAGLTFLEAGPFMTNPAFRRAVLAKGQNAEVQAYWTDRFERLSEAAQAAYREPLLNKLTSFTADPFIRTLVGQPKPALNLRRVMDRGYVILVNLSPGQLRGNAELLGGLFLGALVSAAYSRTDLPEEGRRPFFIYTDELQRLASEEFPAIVSELRKYRVGLVVAHQHLAQLAPDVRAALLANAATKVLFRLGPQDAGAIRTLLTAQEWERWSERLSQFPVGQALVLQPNAPARTLHTERPSFSDCDEERLQVFRQYVMERFARPRKDVEKAIAKRRAELAGGRHRNLGLVAVGGAPDEGQSDW